MPPTIGAFSTRLDEAMLTAHGVAIAVPGFAADQLPVKTGAAVYREIGERYLLLYVRADQVAGVMTNLVRTRWVTPTVLTPADVGTMLLVPDPHRLRSFAFLLDPRQIPAISGPQWVAPSGGIQYILPDGFPLHAIVVPGAPGAAWAVRVA